MPVTPDKLCLSELTTLADQAAGRLRSQGRPLPVIGQKRESREVQRRGFLGRVETLTETFAVPITLPGWPIGINRVMVRSGDSQQIDEVVLTPDGQIHTYRIDITIPEDARIVSPFARYAVAVAQSNESQCEWVSTGNGGDVAARYSRSITAGDALRRMNAGLRELR